MTVSGEDNQVYEKVSMITESQTFSEINRILEFIYKPALDGIDKINKAFIAHKAAEDKQLTAY